MNNDMELNTILEDKYGLEDVQPVKNYHPRNANKHFSNNVGNEGRVFKGAARNLLAPNPEPFPRMTSNGSAASI